MKLVKSKQCYFQLQRQKTNSAVEKTIPVQTSSKQAMSHHNQRRLLVSKPHRRSFLPNCLERNWSLIFAQKTKQIARKNFVQFPHYETVLVLQVFEFERSKKFVVV